MDPATLIPTPDVIPVHWGWFQLLLLVTFFMHILLMNVMVGTAFIAAVSHFYRDGGSSPATTAISEKLPFAIAFAVNFGVAPLLFLQVLYGHFIYTSSILMAVFWLWIIAMVIAAYYLAYIYKYKYLQLNKGRAILTGLITLLLLLVGFLFSNNITMMLQPETWARYLERPNGLLLNLADPSLWPRYLHFMCSAVAVGGMAIALFFSYKRHKGESGLQPWIRYGCSWFGYATFANFWIGAWFAGSLPRGLITMDSANGVFLLIFLISAIITAVFAVVLALREQVLPACSALLGTLALMVLVRDRLRSAYLQPWFAPDELTVQASYSPLIIFLLFFVFGIALIVWMLRLTWKNLDSEEVSS
ncbi:hypothetical protein [Desulfogranum mediterraneum]|uniref:hypothetical protein n=1 Tax=Desulfogranum mediterraneum TaxID=160661 RepID=UPI0003F927C2|nr:hypothetical protein [Desulfogranum mediterraneum]